MLQRRRLGASAIIYLVVLAVLTNFFIAPSQGVGDNIGGWPVGQLDTSGDSSLHAAPAEAPETQPNEVSFFDVLWVTVKALL